mmetsp:Transcript_50837/g.135703  ORF Transcript_50837/g.135703 Transcript_50837/m.135703 type:complete len:324 (-) Transcript_50837:599-1570(-)
MAQTLLGDILVLRALTDTHQFALFVDGSFRLFIFRFTVLPLGGNLRRESVQTSQLTSLDRGLHQVGSWLHARTDHVGKESQRRLPLIVLHAATHRDTVRDTVRSQPGTGHLAKQLESVLPLAMRSPFTSAQDSAVSHDVGLNPARFHLCQETQSHVPIVLLLADTYGRTVRNDIRFHARLPHLLEQGNRICSLLARANRSSVGNRVGLDPVLLHVSQELHGSLVFLTLRAGADGRRVRDNVWNHLGILHLLHEGQGTMALLPLVTGAHGCAVRGHLWSQPILGHLTQERKRQLPLTSATARANGGVKSDVVTLHTLRLHPFQV